MLTRAVWPKPEAVEALKKVVPLAVHRYRKDPKNPKAYPPSLWAIRFDVMAYPQFRFVNGDGSQLQVSNEVVRSVEGLQDAVARAVAAMSKKVDRHRVRWSDLATFNWIDKETSTERLRDLIGNREDPVVQLMALDRLAELPPDDELRWALRFALWASNDWVRQRALQLLPKLTDKREAAEMAKRVIFRALSSSWRFNNPNNMLMAALRVAKELPDAVLVPYLTKVVKTRGGNNMATLYAVETLIAIGKAQGFDEVKEALELGKKVEGHLAPRIRKLIDSVKQ